MINVVITKNRFDSDKFHGREKFNAVLKFLYEHKGNAYKSKEISSNIELNANHVNVVLVHLENRDLVLHKSPYWRITKKGEKLVAK